jgi:hypothetical protein
LGGIQLAKEHGVSWMLESGVSRIPEQSTEHAERTHSEAEKLNYDGRSFQAFLLFFFNYQEFKGVFGRYKGLDFPGSCGFMAASAGRAMGIVGFTVSFGVQKFVCSGFSSCKGLDALPHGAT